ncbi:hypothetical protein [Halalkalibacter akibai]|uniref:Uncharacterized protein n=1 Tax=Halalkalibacter akibai (strain ATCC 43226 / DSM 21942 / CIP 109018 / JCM 9157 / 1139) TaxID=1236973 RepID=W4QZT2_HALA3|nr:hypothetical protein [Halalkalibacter akibai]GAE36824.1 hypothetical protein JCM9157_4044 [Halalkalibacter akibai JCM 9157]
MKIDANELLSFLEATKVSFDEEQQIGFEAVEDCIRGHITTNYHSDGVIHETKLQSAIRVIEPTIAFYTDSGLKESEKLRVKESYDLLVQTAKEAICLRNAIEVFLETDPTGEEDEEMVLDSAKDYLRGVIKGVW